MGESPPVCGHCGGPQVGYAAVHGTPVCHPDDGLDCYMLVTTWGHSMPCESLEADYRTIRPVGNSAPTDPH